MSLKEVTELLKNDNNARQEEIQLLTNEKKSLEEEINFQEKEIQLLIKEKISLENSIQKIFTSTSWKITKPIRFLKKKINAFKEQIMRIS